MHENCVPREEFERVVSELLAYVRILEARIKELEARLAQYENPHTPPSMRINRYPRREKSGRPVGKPVGSPGGTRKLPNPDEIIDVEQEHCKRCKAKLGQPIGYKVRRILEIPPIPKIKVVEYRLADYGRCNCGAENIASHPNCPTQGIASPATLAFVQDLRMTERLSIGLTLRFLKERFGVDLSPAAIVSFTSRTAKLLKNKHFELLVRIRSSKVVYIDETGFYLNGKRIWMWIFTNGKDVLVAIRPSRGSRVIKSILGSNFRGVIVSDCFSAYLRYKATYQKCWAHLLREAKACAQHSEEGKALFEELRITFERIKSFLNNPTDREAEYESLLNCLDSIMSKLFEDWRVRRLVKRLERYREAWLTCILVPGVEPTNNIVERALRPHVVLRRLRGTSRSEEALHDYEIIGSLMATWQCHGLNPAEELEKELCSIFTGS